MVRFSLGRVAQPSFYPTGNTLRDRDGFLMGAKQWNTESRHTLSVKVHIESRTEGAEVFYTIDGTDPVPFVGPRPEGSSTRRYTRKPVALNFDEDGFKNFSLRAVAVCPGLLPSKVGESPVYTVQGKVKIVKFTEVRREDMVMLSMECATPGNVGRARSHAMRVRCMDACVVFVPIAPRIGCSFEMAPNLKVWLQSSLDCEQLLTSIN